MAVLWAAAPCSVVEIYRRFRGFWAMMEAVSTSKTSINFYQTMRRNISEDSRRHTRRRENLKPDKVPNTFSASVLNTFFQQILGLTFSVVGSVCQKSNTPLGLWFPNFITPRNPS
jgi:hypothetical protein